MIFYQLNPSFGSSYQYEEFYQKVGGKFWQNLETPITNLRISLTDRDYLLSMFNFGGLETKDEKAIISVDYENGEITIKIECHCRFVEHKSVTKTVNVNGEDFFKVVTIRNEHEWEPYTGYRIINFGTIETAD